VKHASAERGMQQRIAIYFAISDPARKFGRAINEGKTKNMFCNLGLKLGGGLDRPKT